MYTGWKCIDLGHASFETKYYNSSKFKYDINIILTMSSLLISHEESINISVNQSENI